MSTRDAVARAAVTPAAAGPAEVPASDPAPDTAFDPPGTPVDPPADATAPRAPGSGAPPALSDVAWTAATTAVKATIIALAADAFINSHKPRFQGKAMRVRALGYTSALLIVPLAWRLRGRREPYPRELDLLVALPLLADAGGNAIGMYQNAHVDDAIHFANGALLAGVVGSVVAPRDRTAWEAATFATAVSTAVAAGWEMFEWIGLKLGAKGMDLSYDDTMHDLIETTAGAFLGGLVTLLRHPARLRQVPGRPGDPIVKQPA